MGQNEESTACSGVTITRFGTCVPGLVGASLRVCVCVCVCVCVPFEERFPWCLFLLSAFQVVCLFVWFVFPPQDRLLSVAQFVFLFFFFSFKLVGDDNLSVVWCWCGQHAAIWHWNELVGNFTLFLKPSWWYLFFKKWKKVLHVLKSDMKWWYQHLLLS